MLTIEEIKQKLANNEKISWFYISENQILTEDFIREFQDKLNWHWISIKQTLSEEFIQEFKDKVIWNHISAHQVLSESFIEKFKDKANWVYISKYQTLTESFIKKHKNKVNWAFISMHQVLSQDFIREFKDKLNWSLISKHQILSENSIREFKDKVYWDFIIKYQKLSNKFIEEFNLSIPKSNMYYWTDKRKINHIKKFGFEYNKKEKCLYAYKSVHRNLSSVFNPIFKYQLNEKIINRNCDCNINKECSFGLSAWDKEQALDYYNEGKLLKVKIDLKDLGCITSEGKIRAFALTPIEIIE